MISLFTTVMAAADPDAVSTTQIFVSNLKDNLLGVFTTTFPIFEIFIAILVIFFIIFTLFKINH